jgi:hypothetical protein
MRSKQLFNINLTAENIGAKKDEGSKSIAEMTDPDSP